MLPNGISRVFKVIVVSGVLVSAFMVFRLSKLDPASVVPTYNADDAVETYKERVRATENVLKHDRL